MKTARVIMKGLVLIAGFALVGLATYFTGNANCLWALILVALVASYF